MYNKPTVSEEVKNPKPEQVTFKKSSLSASGNCVEVAELKDGGIVVRDSKNPQGSVLIFTRSEWKAFIGGVKQREFDLT